MRTPHLPGHLLVKLKLGEAPAAVASALDVRSGLATPWRRFGLGAVDRMLRHRANEVAIDRVHGAASSLHRPGHRHEGFDTLEHVLGLSRTFRVRCEPTAPVHELALDLLNVHEVEAAGALPLSTAPFSSVIVAPPGGAPHRLTDRSREVVGAADALQAEPGIPSVTLAILDTGIAADRRLFTRHVLRGFDTVQLGHGELLPGLELLGDTSDFDVDPEDEVGHGTACAGITGASGSDGLPRGMAGSCTVMPVRVLGSVRRVGTERRLGVGSPTDIDQGVKRAVDLGAKVLNCSFGTPLAQVDPLAPVPHADVVRYALARGCVVVAAAGNSGREEAYAPAALPGVLAVGSVDQDGQPSGFSSRGAHVDLCAPGAGVLTAGIERPVLVTGTSFAAPFVAAVAALLVCHAARRAHPLHPAAVADLLRSSARPWPSETAGWGVGVLDAPAAIRALDRRVDYDAPARAGPGTATTAPGDGTPHERN